eukprot:TRINITY_DN6037_c0_g1_i1.p1 TRINITY_DN6037_c0_g1~~TRINITY_DN6037_c0_g1_i1.p1  ORF type:complete len:227 (+),score=33.92 TRINITY_DN6037_c0_g1_i1:95-775(+)
MFAKTKLCKFNLVHKCTRGKDCVWAHSQSELKATPDLSRTKLCKEIRSGGQCSDPNCKFAHSKDELRPVKERAGKASKHKEAKPRLPDGPTRMVRAFTVDAAEVVHETFPNVSDVANRANTADPPGLQRQLFADVQTAVKAPMTTVVMPPPGLSGLNEPVYIPTKFDCHTDFKMADLVRPHPSHPLSSQRFLGNLQDGKPSYISNDDLVIDGYTPIAEIMAMHVLR